MIVDCSAPHWGEVYALTPIDAETLPDFEELNTMAFQACTPAFEEYVGTPYEESSLDATWYFPNASNWDAGEHVIACVAVPLEAPSLTQSGQGLQSVTCGLSSRGGSAMAGPPLTYL